MSILSRVVLAGLACASLTTGAARAQEASTDANTKDRFLHAGKCVVTLGFGGDCDQKTPPPKKPAADTAVLTPASTDTSTRHQFMHASECVVTLGFLGHCDKDAPAARKAPSASSQRAEASPAPGPGPAPAPAPAATPDNSTRHQFMHAGKCVVTLGFGGGCDSK